MAVDLAQEARERGIKYFLISYADLFGTIRAKLYEDNYIKRPPVSLVIETLNQVSAKAH